MVEEQGVVADGNCRVKRCSTDWVSADEDEGDVGEVGALDVGAYAHARGSAAS